MNEDICLAVGFFHRILARAVHWSQKQKKQKQGGPVPKLLFRKATFYADCIHDFRLEKIANLPSMIKVNNSIA